jgi:hypothetical protein
MLVSHVDEFGVLGFGVLGVSPSCHTRAYLFCRRENCMRRQEFGVLSASPSSAPILVHTCLASVYRRLYGICSE